MTTQEILEAARAAKQAVALASSRTRQSVLERMADALCAPDSVEAILAANAEDMAAAKGHISDVMLDRLALTPVPVWMQGTLAFSTQAWMSPAPPRGMSRST